MVFISVHHVKLVTTRFQTRTFRIFLFLLLFNVHITVTIVITIFSIQHVQLVAARLSTGIPSVFWLAFPLTYSLVCWLWTQLDG